jgi:hypothetical protein
VCSSDLSSPRLVLQIRNFLKSGCSHDKNLHIIYSA